LCDLSTTDDLERPLKVISTTGNHSEPMFKTQHKTCIRHIVKLLLLGLMWYATITQTSLIWPLGAEIVSLVWGIPENFNEFRVLAALLHGTLVVGISHTLRR